MNLNEMKTLIRRDLRDEDATDYRWSDNELERHIAHAVEEASETVPGEQKSIIATISGSRDIDISSLADRVVVQAVEYPVGKFPPRYRRFSLWGDTLTLQSEELPNGGNACIYYGKLHTLHSQACTIPAYLEDLIISGASGYAAVEWAIFSTNRVNAGGSDASANFLIRGTEKLKYFTEELKRLGRRHRTRLNQLYKPHYPITSKTTDYGPY
jgi:hypothetical protein